jgi:hypothetical protein
MQRTIEQLILLIANKQDAEPSDLFFFSSLLRQLNKNLSLTHKQFDSARSKLIKYKEYFSNKGIENFEETLTNVSMPLRVADKEKSIRLVEATNQFNNYSKNFIEVKFPFNKKEINIIENLKKTTAVKNNSYYKKNNCHYFSYTDEITYLVVNSFLDRNYTVDDQLKNTYEKTKFIKEHPHLYVPGIYGNQLKNLHKTTQEAIIDELGELSTETAIKYLDRKLRFGLEKIEFCDDLANSIELYSPSAVKIASRKTSDYLSKPEDEKLEDLLKAVVELDRLPLLVVLSDQISPSVVLDQLVSLHSFFEKIISNDAQSVLFRLDNTTDTTSKQFNSYIKEHKINNWVDNSTKVVYINYDKLPKVLLNSNWKPLASLSFSTLNRSAVSVYVESVCDLNIVREKDFSIIKQYKKNK